MATPNPNICIRAVSACKQSILCHPLLNQPNRPQKQRASFDTLSIVFAIDEVETEWATVLPAIIADPLYSKEHIVNSIPIRMVDSAY